MEKKNTENPDFKSVEQLFRQYYKVLRAYAYRFVNDLGVAEDIVQDVFVALWNRRTEIDYDGAVKSYLFRAVYNKSLNHLNSKTYTDEESVELFVGQLDINSVQENNQENNLIVKELQEEINAIIATFPEQVRQVFVLSRGYGLKNREVADQLGLSLKTVEKYISRALTDLRIRLQDNDLIGLLLLLSVFAGD